MRIFRDIKIGIERGKASNENGKTQENFTDIGRTRAASRIAPAAAVCRLDVGHAGRQRTRSG
ncbi:protein of unknown function [Paraburkholderia kururiensis]